MISHPRYCGDEKYGHDEWIITLHDEEPVPAEFVKLVKHKVGSYVVFIDDSDTETTYTAEDIDGLIQALTDLKPYI